MKLKKYPFIILLSIVFIANIYAQASSITPFQRVKDNGYIEIDQIIFYAPTITGNPVFINSSPPYSIQYPFQNPYNYFGQHQITSTDFQSQMNGTYGYSLNSIVSTSPVSSIRIQLQVYGSSMISRLKLNLIVITAVFTSYMQFSQKTITSPMSPQFFVNQDVVNTKFIPLVKSFIMTYTGTLGSTPQQWGFKTNGSKVFDVNNTMVYQVYFAKTPSNGNFTVSVTYVVIQILEVQLQKTAQFINLQITVSQGYTTTNSTTIMPTNYESNFTGDIISSPIEYSSMITNKPFYSLTMNDSGVTIVSNNFGGFAQYSIIDFKDLQCPTTNPYKKKGDPLCYTCPNIEMILINGNPGWSELNSTFTNPICTKINLTLSIYQYDTLTGQVKSVCGYCRACTAQYYLEVGVCKKCSQKMVGCAQCTSNSTCTKCSTGYFLQSDTCKPCNNSLSNCLSCTSASACSSCASGSYLSNGQCNDCILGCEKCSTDQTCDQCLTGYFMDLNKCLSCNQHNLNCIECGSNGFCTKCQPGFYASDLGKCEICNTSMSNCLQCSLKSNCTKCSDGYQFSYSNVNDISSNKYCMAIVIVQGTNTNKTGPVDSQQSPLKKILGLALGIGLPLLIFIPIAICIIRKQLLGMSVTPEINEFNPHDLTPQQIIDGVVVHDDNETFLSRIQKIAGRLLDRLDKNPVQQRLDINLNLG